MNDSLAGRASRRRWVRRFAVASLVLVCAACSRSPEELKTSQQTELASLQASDDQVCQEVADTLSGKASRATETPFLPARLVPGLDAGGHLDFDPNSEFEDRFAWVTLGPEGEYLAVLDDGEPSLLSGDPKRQAQRPRSIRVVDAPGPFPGERLFYVGKRPIAVSSDRSDAKVWDYAGGRARLLCALTSAGHRKKLLPRVMQQRSALRDPELCALAAADSLAKVSTNETFRLHRDDAHMQGVAATKDWPVWRLHYPDGDESLTLARISGRRPVDGASAWFVSLDKHGRVLPDERKTKEWEEVPGYTNFGFDDLANPELLQQGNEYFIEAAVNNALRLLSVYPSDMSTFPNGLEDLCRFELVPIFRAGVSSSRAISSSPPLPLSDRRMCEEVSNALTGEPSLTSAPSLSRFRSLVPGLSDEERTSLLSSGEIGYGYEMDLLYALVRLGVGPERLVTMDTGGVGGLCPSESMSTAETADDFPGNRLFFIGGRPVAVNLQSREHADVWTFDDGRTKPLCRLAFDGFRNRLAPAWTRRPGYEPDLCAMAERNGLTEVAPTGTFRLRKEDASRLYSDNTGERPLWHLSARPEAPALDLVQLKEDYGGHKGSCRDEKESRTWLFPIEDGRIASKDRRREDSPVGFIGLPPAGPGDGGVSFVAQSGGSLDWARLLKRNDEYFIEAAPNGSENATGLYRLRGNLPREVCRFKRLPNYRVLLSSTGELVRPERP
ncbi:hypothetical protein [Variovorax sp. J31P207]|uniref:hypothetical protein n=1 Tax=Variovorax sp. J31P207 TaxID=3053510 RepID=UPI0025783D7E|nr:hypothetical protein [Variovorax sp. J31P207]MDM0070569.1 hypothetical protein [Variovorax sp. J31P207]